MNYTIQACIKRHSDHTHLDVLDHTHPDHSKCLAGSSAWVTAGCCVQLRGADAPGNHLSAFHLPPLEWQGKNTTSKPRSKKSLLLARGRENWEYSFIATLVAQKNAVLHWTVYPQGEQMAGTAPPGIRMPYAGTHHQYCLPGHWALGYIRKWTISGADAAVTWENVPPTQW